MHRERCRWTTHRKFTSHLISFLTEAVAFITIIIIQGMLDEADGPMNFTQMVTLFASKMAGGTDDDETILKSFEVRSIVEGKCLVPDWEKKSTLA
jgi:hypothetical protein